MSVTKVVSLLCLLAIDSVAAKTGEEWKTRIIYQLLTDRFSRDVTIDSSASCQQLRDYCGGTFNGIRQRLEYIKGLGANAIWISPFVENTDKGFHGYWAKNLYSVNPYFGSEKELMELVSACQEQGVWVMMDVVTNHMGYPPGNFWNHNDMKNAFNFTQFVPFNETLHFHDYCEINNFNNQTEVEVCRLGYLPDLNETEPFVRETLLQWIRDITRRYHFDGYRVDTVVEMPKAWWHDFSRAVPESFMLGEANNGDVTCYMAAYQGPLPSVLNFPLYWALRRIFTEHQPMTVLTASLAEQRRCFQDTSLLGVFVDNHDFPRFLSLQNDSALLTNALTYILFTEGIPILYYGTEQAFDGDGDPNNRESLWPHYDTQAPLYQLIRSLTSARARCSVNLAGRNQAELYVDNDTVLFARGDRHELLVMVTNLGSRSDPEPDKQLDGLPYADGAEFQNMLEPSETIRIVNGTTILSRLRGLPKVFRQVVPPSSGAPGPRDVMSLLFTVASVLCCAALACSLCC